MEAGCGESTPSRGRRCAIVSGGTGEDGKVGGAGCWHGYHHKNFELVVQFYFQRLVTIVCVKHRRIVLAVLYVRYIIHPSEIRCHKEHDISPPKPDDLLYQQSQSRQEHKE